jgi:hypothetical protein
MYSYEAFTGVTHGKTKIVMDLERIYVKFTLQLYSLHA